MGSMHDIYTYRHMFIDPYIFLKIRCPQGMNALLTINTYYEGTVHLLPLSEFSAGVWWYVCVCVFSSHPFWTSSSLDVPAGVTQEEGHTGFLIYLPSAVRALIFVARRIQPFLSLVDREVEFCVLTN